MAILSWLAGSFSSYHKHVFLLKTKYITKRNTWISHLFFTWMIRNTMQHFNNLFQCTLIWDIVSSFLEEWHLIQLFLKFFSQVLRCFNDGLWITKNWHISSNTSAYISYEYEYDLPCVTRLYFFIIPKKSKWSIQKKNKLDN